MAQSKRWLKKQKQKLKKKLSDSTKSEKLDIVKSHLDTVHLNYSGLIGMIPDIEKRIHEIGEDDYKKDLKKMWSNVLVELKRVKDRPKAMKIYYAKRVVSKIKKLRKKYPME